MVPTRRFALLAGLTALALFAYPGSVGGLFATVVVLNVILLAIAVVDGFAAVAPSKLDIVREHPPVVVMGQAAQLRWTVKNTASRTAKFLLADELAPSLVSDQRRAGATLTSESTAVLSTTIHPTRRGRFEPTEIVVRVAGPLGLMVRQSRRELRTLLRVHPPFKSRDEADLRVRQSRVQQVGLRSARGLGGGTEFEALREYSTDDEFRRVDWAASARAGKPIVRTYRPELNQSVVVLLDNGRLMAANVAGVPRLEHAMDAAMMLTAVTTGLGDKIGMVTFDQEVRSTIPPARRPNQLTLVTEAMFDLQPVFAESDYQVAFKHTLARFRRRSLLVLLTDLAQGAATASLLPALPLICRNHLVVIGAIRDPDVAEWAKGPALDAEQVFRKTAAIELLAQRERLTAQLRGLGVTVVDEVPGRIAGALADAYLNVKSRGRL